MSLNKRNVVLAIVLMLLFCSFANAEDVVVDYSSMSFEELIEINTQVTNELVKRGDDRFVVLPSGTYLVGRDIAPGQYKISLHKLGEEAWLNLIVFLPGVTPESYYDAISASNDRYFAYKEAKEAGKDVERPEGVEDSMYLAMGKQILSDNGDISVSLEEGQTLSVNIQYDCVATIEKSKGLFME